MRLNVHAHVLALDGVYVREGPDGALVFHPLPAPTRADVTEVARRTAARVERILRARGRSLDPQMQTDDPHMPLFGSGTPSFRPLGRADEVLGLREAGGA